MFDDTHRLSFGCSSLGGLYAPLGEAEAEALLDGAWDLGLRYFDTAPHYGNGMSEHRLGRFLRDRTGWLLSTKVGRVLEPDAAPEAVINGFHSSLPFRQRFDYSYDGIMRSVEDSFNRLGLNRIDILYVHDLADPDAGTDTPNHMSDFLDGGITALEELRSSGVVRAVGLGVNTVEVCTAMIGQMPMDLILLAGRYTLLEQSAVRQLFPLCTAHNVRLVIGGVFNSGILATGPRVGATYNYAPAPDTILARTARIEAICARHGVPLATAALQFPARNPLIASTLIGTSKLSSLTRNVAQYDSPVPAELWQDLSQAGLIEGHI